MRKIGPHEIAAVGQVLLRGQLLRYQAGPTGFTNRFEQMASSKFGAQYVLAVNSGTSALTAALVAAGIGPGDEVLIPAFTWISTALAVLNAGAIPIIVDIDETLTIDPADMFNKMSPFTRAIIPVHMLNRPCDMEKIVKIAHTHGWVIVEDACQATGICYRGQRLGTIGDIGAFSFNQYKNMSSGEGGAIVTNSAELYGRSLMFCDPGTPFRAKNVPVDFMASMNFRVSELTGALLYAQLRRLDPLIERLTRRTAMLEKMLASTGKVKISPHHDPSRSASLCVIFDDADTAARFARQPGVSRLLDSPPHIFKNWSPILRKSAFDDRRNPYNFSQRVIDYPPELCEKTINILSRSCNILLKPEIPWTLFRYRAKNIVSSLL